MISNHKIFELTGVNSGKNELHKQTKQEVSPAALADGDIVFDPL
jgi:hypothetical protein